MAKVIAAYHAMRKLTSAHERAIDILDREGFAGHQEPQTTLTCIQTGDRLSKSSAYVL